MSERRGSSFDSSMPKIVKVPHLGGIDVSYRMPKPYRQYKPTLVMINSFTTSADLYKAQFANEKLADLVNLIAIEPLGHGDTRAKFTETFTYWDTAVAVFQVMDALAIKQAFALGTSQGGWIVARMALYAPDRILGIIPLGTSMDNENERTIKLGCWDGYKEVTPLVEESSAKTAQTSFEPSDEYCNYLIDIGFGKDIDSDTRKLWTENIKKNYRGEDGRKRIREAAINLRDRDGLHARLPNIKCPVLWLHGDKDAVYSVKNAEEEIKLFTNSPDAKVMVVKNGHHFLSWTNSEAVDNALMEFIPAHSKGFKPSGRALREAVGMVEM